MIFPVLLCGGTGTRLWPLSRESYPKQFVKIIGEDSLFQQAARRVSGKIFMPPTVLTNTEFRFIVSTSRSPPGLGILQLTFLDALEPLWCSCRSHFCDLGGHFL